MGPHSPKFGTHAADSFANGKCPVYHLQRRDPIALNSFHRSIVGKTRDFDLYLCGDLGSCSATFQARGDQAPSDHHNVLYLPDRRSSAHRPGHDRAGHGCHDSPHNLECKYRESRWKALL